MRAAAETTHAAETAHAFTLLQNTGHLRIEYSFEAALKHLLAHPLLVAAVVVVGGIPSTNVSLIRRGVGFTFPHLLVGKPDS